MVTLNSRVLLLSIFSLCINLLLPDPARSQSPVTMLYYNCTVNGNYSTDSPYESNLKALLNSMHTNNDINYGFYNFTVGDSVDQVFGIALCRPDITPEPCRACIKDASANLTALCPNFKEAIGGADDCMVRYSNKDIFHREESETRFWVYNVKSNVTNVTGFNQSVNSLLANLSYNASRSTDSRYKFAVGNLPAPDSQTVYGLVQCTPDLSQSECSDCLYKTSGLIPICCPKTDGARLIYPSCNFRYEVSQFWDTIDIPPLTTPSTKDKKNIIIAVVVSVVACLVLIVSCILLRRWKERDGGKILLYESGYMEETESLQFDFETVRMATNNFSDDNKLGQGGFGPVYKGTLLDGQEIAVKRLSKASSQGDMEFRNEVLLVAKLQHRNLVRLRGFSVHRVEKEKLLIYEFLPNSSLDHYLFGPIKRGILGWADRYKIVEGIARGLLYLHEDSRLRIIHRDMKASNVLLDEEMNPKISDFGMARMFSVDQTQADTSKIVGTLGYMAPEYIKRGHFSIKSDVYSFGVLVLEILSGKRIGGDRIEENGEDLITFAWRNWSEGTPMRVFDPSSGMGSSSEKIRCLQIGLLCVQEHEGDRPTMAQVVVMLSSYSLTLRVPHKPAFYMYSDRSGGTTQIQPPVGLSLNDASITDPYPR